MKFRQLAVKNVLGNRHQYSAFFLSSVFSVMIFYIYASFIFHPDVIHGHIRGGDGARMGMIACEYIIMVFSFFFVLYSCSAFLKSRKKEFGLLLLYGFTKNQLRRMVLYENMLIGVAATVVGIGLGVLFSKLFLMAMSELMRVESPMDFGIPLYAVWVTAGGYILLFFAINVLSMRKAGRDEIITLMNAAKEPKAPPRASWWLVLLSMICLGLGYWLAYTMSPNTIVFTMLPIVFVVVLGTYFLYTQSSVAILKWLGRRKSIYYRSTNMIVISQLAHKIKDNARVLFLVTTLCAVVLTASGTLNVFYSGSRAEIYENTPQTFSFVEDGVHTHSVIDPERVKSVIEKNGLTLRYELALVGLPVRMNLPKVGEEAIITLISEKDYNLLVERMNHIEPVHPDKGQAYYINPYTRDDEDFVTAGEKVIFQAAGAVHELVMSGQRAGRVAEPGRFMVLNDSDYTGLISQVSEEELTVTYGFEVEDWESKQALQASEELRQSVPAEESYRLISRPEMYSDTIQASALTLFIAVFISILFFMASGSLLFFKMFTELQEEQAQFRALSRIGITVQEMKRIVTMQIGMLFYIPVMVGAVHAAFAMKALGNVLYMEVWGYAGVVLLIYLGLQTVYFLFARRSYLQRMKMAAVI